MTNNTTTSVASDLVRVDAKFMQNFRITAPVMGFRPAAAQNRNGRVEVFLVDAQGDILNCYPDSTSDTGWSMTKLGLNTGSPFLVELAAGRTAEGNLIVFVRTASAVYYMLENPPASAARWQAPQKLNIAAGTPNGIACKNIGGKLYVAAAVAGTENSVSYYAINFGVWNTEDPSLKGFIRQNEATARPHIGFVENAFTNFGVQLVVSYENNVSFAGANITTETEVTPTPAASSSGLNVRTFAAADQDGYGKLFGILSDMNLYFMDLKQSSQWVQQLSNGFPLQYVAAQTNADGFIEVFATGMAGYKPELFHLRQDPNVEGGWTELANLGVPADGILAAAGNADGYVRAFTSGPTGVVFSLIPEPDTTDFLVSHLEVQAQGEIEPVTSYTTEITVLDSEGKPSSEQQVQIWSPDLELLTINGKTYAVDAKRPFTGTANAAGQVTVVSATNSLSTPLLKVSTGFMEPGTSVVIEPNLEIQNRLKNLTADELLNTQVNGQDLLESPYRADASTVADSIRTAMSLAEPTIGVRGAGPRQMVTLLSAGAPFSSQIDLSLVPKQHWSIDFSSGRPVFRMLTGEEARAAFAATSADDQEPGGLFGISWGDLWTAVREGVGRIVKVTVGVFEDAIHTIVDYAIGAIKGAINAVVNLVEKVFDIVEGVFAQVAIGFSKLFDWLAFLFDWSDIIRTKDAIKYLLDVGLDVMLASLSYLQQRSANLFTSLDQQIQQAFQTLIQNTLGQSTIVATSDTAPHVDNFEKSKSNNIVGTAFVNHAGDSAVLSAAPEAFSETAGAVSSFLQACEGFWQEFEGAQDFVLARDYFQQAIADFGSHPDRALRLAFAGLLQAVSGLARLAVKLTGKLLDALFSGLTAIIAGFRKLINTPWNIPFVTPLYGLITKGGTLTALDVLALVAAIPTTLFYKLLCNEAPFPQPDSIDAFAAVFNKANIVRAIGFGAASQQPGSREDPNPLPAQLGRWLKFIGGSCIFCSAVGAIFNGCCDLIPPVPDPLDLKLTAGQVAFSVASVVMAALAWSTSCPYYSDKTLVDPPGFDKPGPFSALIWCWSTINWGTDVAFLIDAAYEGKPGRKKILSGDLGVGINTFLGLVMFGLSGGLVAVQVKNNEYSGYTTAANMMTSCAMTFGFLRFTFLSNSYSRVALAIVDLVCTAGAGVINYSLLRDSFPPLQLEAAS